jgi:kynurenine formamidase
MKRKNLFLIVGVVILLAILSVLFSSLFIQEEKVEPSLLEIYNIFKKKEFIDLTHAFEPGIPRWPGYPDMKIVRLYNYSDEGFISNYYCFPCSYGTHLDAPSEFVPNGRRIDEISVKEMILPLVVIDVEDKCQVNPDYQIKMEDISEWEEEHGRIPKDSFAIMKSGWSKRFSNPELFRNKDEKGQDHYPGWSMEVLEFLVKERNIKGIGHEPFDGDSALSQLEHGWECEIYALEMDLLYCEVLNIPDELPEAGGLIVITIPKLKDGEAFPARIFAIV